MEAQRNPNPQHGGYHQTLLSGYRRWKCKGYLNWKVVGRTILVVSLPRQCVHHSGHVNIVAHRPQLSWTVGTIPPAACIVPPDSMKASQQGGSSVQPDFSMSYNKRWDFGLEGFPSQFICCSGSVNEVASGSYFQLGPCPTSFQEQRGQSNEKYFIVI